MFCNAEEMVHISGDADEQDQTKLKDLKGPDRDCYALLKQMQARETAERQESEWKIDQVDGMDALRLGTSNPASQAVNGLDQADVEACLSGDVPAELKADQDDGSQNNLPTLPKTGVSTSRCLFDVLEHPTVKEDAKHDQVWLHLWRLLVRLRADEGMGCDSLFLKNHRSCR